MKRQRSTGEGPDDDRSSPHRRFYPRNRFEFQRRDFTKGFRSDREKSSSFWRRSSNWKDGFSQDYNFMKNHRSNIENDAEKKNLEEIKEICDTGEREEGEFEPDADFNCENGHEIDDQIKEEKEINELCEKELDMSSTVNPETQEKVEVAEKEEEDSKKKKKPEEIELFEAQLDPEKSLRLMIEKGKGIANSMDDDPMEGPSCRGFDLFSPRSQKVSNGIVIGGTRETTQLDLSLSLPGASSSGQPSQNPNPNSNMLRAISDGFATSVSFSGSQRTAHNPSCSLTHTSVDTTYWENSVGSRPLFKPVDLVNGQVNVQFNRQVTVPVNGQVNGQVDGQVIVAANGQVNGQVDGQGSQRCRNPQCGSIVPVDDCECKVCSGRKGFCSQCMCLVCGEYDSASNTCAWVGCDVCQHWCHTDCALRYGHIRNGRRGGDIRHNEGSKEVQFLCVACGHPSEMFGFVKEVVRTCALGWGKEVLVRELEFVCRIFASAEDTRGAGLRDMAASEILCLEKNVSPGEVVQQVLAFLSETDSPSIVGGGGASTSAAPPPKLETTIAPPTKPGTTTTSNRPTSSATAPIAGMSNRPTTSLMAATAATMNRPTTSSMAAAAAGTGDELEGVVKFKRAEAEMYQWRAEEARREAEGLRRIAAAKVGKIEEDFSRRLARLRLAEAEERRRLKLQELHSLDRAHREFHAFKSRMEADIRDLLLKMDAAQSRLPRS